ncbi:MAG TPA: hypothetical protein PL048_13615 [Leptospiraceae bacterium]|nr:hypothetical protein [Leptospiraceae bacterium]HMY67890.1 hypothetical protein [Leptospiraceae bacterium]HMZ59812.1 hypothetical protein [Leptospiraceae bacterium]HNF12917.1 hypothetical protein [Leptospiraceae bacterium]HNF24959.1 hypothetical protein [Leptospiraceae bacterium]
MRFFLKISFLLLSLSLYSSDRLPDPMPDDIVIKYYKPLGHAGSGFSMELTRKGCRYEDTKIQKSNGFDFSLSEDELKAVYRILQENKIDRIGYTDGLIHDYDGVSLSVHWKTGNAEVSQSGRKVSSRWLNEWKTVTDVLEKIREKEYSKALQEYSVFIDQSLLGNFIHIQSDTGLSLRKYINQSVLKENPIRAKTLPGTHSVYCILYQGYDLKKRNEIYSDFDPERASLWDEKHNAYINTLKTISFSLKLDTSSKKSFRIMKKGDQIIIQ